MENITQVSTSLSNIQKSTSKPVSEKKKAVVKKKTVRQQAEKQSPKLKVSVVLSSNPSEDSFNSSKKNSAVATITPNQILKLAVLVNATNTIIVSSLNTNSSHAYSLLIIRNISGIFIFTRPPPFILV